MPGSSGSRRRVPRCTSEPAESVRQRVLYDGDAQRTERPPFEAYLKGQPWPAGGVVGTTSLSPSEIGGWIEQFAIGVRLPGAFWRAERYNDGSSTLWTYATDTRSWASADDVPGERAFEVVPSGPRRLWDETAAAFAWWLDHGRPGCERSGPTVDVTGQRVWLDRPDHPVPVARG